MSKSDQYVIFVVSTIIAAQVAAFIIGKITGKLIGLVGILNLITALFIIGYWVLRYFQVQAHIFDMSVTALLVAETMFVLLTAYSMMVHYQHQWLKLLQYGFFSLHLLSAVLFLIFMLSFKMNRLF